MHVSLSNSYLLIIKRYVYKFLGPALFLLFIVIGVINFDQYGVSWDEPAQRAIGYISSEYILGMDDRLLTYVDKDYGPVFELPLVALEKILTCSDHPCAYLLRHLVGHLFFLTGAFFCYLLVDFLFKNKILASVAFLLVVLNPRHYAHSFFNTKDMPFASWFFVCFYFSALAFANRKLIYFILLAISIAILINLRIAGIEMVGLVLMLFFIDSIPKIEDAKHIRQNILLFIAFFTVTVVVLYLSWPFLWIDPVNNFKYVLNSMSMFRWNGPVLFEGEVILAADLPWYYIPKWFFISIPITYLVLGFLGIIILVINFLKKGFSLFTETIEQHTLTYVICFFLPVAAVIVLKSIVYSDWRHLYFIYSPFVLLIIYAIHYLINSKLRVTLILLPATFITIGLYMFNNNPYQHIYFNSLVDSSTPEYLRSQYELDYWGTSYREALEYILTEDSRQLIQVTPQNPSGEWNKFILTPNDHDRLNFVYNLKDAEYFIANYPPSKTEIADSEWEKFYSIKVSNNTINTVYKRIGTPAP